VFHLPINAAAAQLGFGVTALKKCCRQLGIQRWPYRKLESMQKIASLAQADAGLSRRVSQATPLLEEIK